MPARKIVEDIFSVGAIDWDRTLFDALIPLPHGTTYNSYLIKGSEKTALIDTVEPAKKDALLSNLKSLNVDRIDYIISNHAEQDHSGSLPAVLKAYPTAKIITNSKCRDMLIQLLEIDEEKFQIIADRESISLGDKSLKFILAPWVHWPETMLTFLPEAQILFSCDLFGSHYATSRLFADGDQKVIEEAKRYYAEIMMPFAQKIAKHLENLNELSIDMIAPSHGPVYNDTQPILTAYRQWVSEKVQNEVVLLYVSMHGSTQKMAEYFTDRLMDKNISVKLFNMVSADIGEIASAMVDAATVVFASPAVLMGPHPNIFYAAYLINSLKPKTRYAGVIGSFGWGHKLVDQIRNVLTNFKGQFLDPVLIKGFPGHQGQEELDRLANEISEKHNLVQWS